MNRYSRISWILLAASLAIAVYLLGCGRFFVPVNSGSGSNGSGGSGSAIGKLFVANTNNGGGTTDSVGVFSVSSTGALSHVGSNVPMQETSAGVSAEIIVAGFLYVSEVTSGTLEGFSIASNGALTELAGFPSTISTGGGPVSLAGANIGGNSFLYVLTTSASGSAITVYDVASSGALTQQTTTYSIAVTQPKAIRVSPNGQDLYVALGSLNGVQIYTINSDGSLAFQGTLPVSGSLVSAYDIAFTSDSTNAYIADFQAGQVVHCSVGSNPVGSLNNCAVGGAAGTGPISLAVDHSGGYLYVANNGSSNVSGFSIAANGTLTAISNSPFAAGSSPRWVLGDLSGQFVFVANAGGSPDVSVFSEASGTGVLTSAGTATTGGSAIALVEK